MTRATVLIPTFDHGPTLRHSIASAQQQTVRELEIFVVGDGPPDVTREIIAELSADDPRIRYFDHPKGPRHGEIYRHRALQEACGEIVCYLADDDLWLPDHVERMLEVLASADFAHSSPAFVYTDGTLDSWPVDLSRPEWPKHIMHTGTGTALSTVAHTLDVYRRLPHGWRTTPPDVPTDRFMWLQILGQPGVRAAALHQPTALTFPSVRRVGWSPERRAAELEEWAPRVRDPEWRAGFRRRVYTALQESSVRFFEELWFLKRSPAMRLGSALLRIPVAGKLLRWVAKARDGRAARAAAEPPRRAETESRP